MLEIVKSIAAVVATCTEFIAVVVIVMGAAQAIGAGVVLLVRTKNRTIRGFPRLRWLADNLYEGG